ncbi:hypothetical protein NDU88_004227 [Pleurodeles waltl]|uniref:Uncharacterized protein n=1 Tax=Pleurodeles waltl TaxID=8319 RepID=A0AAV7VFL0_PLEWA|nr:hypothetical protein NDU88_004227 [Pleurodeles waltl]
MALLCSGLFSWGCCCGHLWLGLVLWFWFRDRLGGPDTWFHTSGLDRTGPVNLSTYLCGVLVLGGLAWRTASAGVVHRT